MLAWNPLHLSGQNDSLLTDTFSMQRPDRHAPGVVLACAAYPQPCAVLGLGLDPEN